MRVFICAVLLIVLVFAAPHGKLDCKFADGEKELCDKFEGCEWVADKNWYGEGECKTKFPVIDLDQDMPCTEEGYIQTKADGCHFAADRSNSKFQLLDTSSMTEAGRHDYVVPFGCSMREGTYYWRPADSASASYDRWEFANRLGWKRVCQWNYPDDYCTRFKDCGSCRAFAGNDDFWYRCTYSIEQGCALEAVPGLTYPRYCPETQVGASWGMPCYITYCNGLDCANTQDPCWSTCGCSGKKDTAVGEENQTPQAEKAVGECLAVGNHPFYGPRLKAAGFTDEQKEKVCWMNGEWYYDSHSTCVAEGKGWSCIEHLQNGKKLVCAGGERFYGSIDEQAAAVLAAINNGGVHADARCTKEVQVGSECNNFPPSTCQLCQGVMDFCNGKKYVIKKYTTSQHSALFGCSYPKEYKYVDTCPSGTAVGGNAQLKRINKALLEALETMAN